MASTLEHLQVTHVGRRYQIVMEARMQTTAAKAYATFTNFKKLAAINPAIIKAEPIDGGQEGAQRLHTQVRVGFLRFHWVFDQIQDMYVLPPEEVRATILPERSNLRYGKASWRIWDQNGAAHLSFEAVIEPDFWVPPIIGPWVIEKKLSREAVGTADGIERLANRLP